MKKFMIVILCLFSLFCISCKSKEEKKYKVIIPSGMPLIAFGDLLDNSNFEFDIVNGQDPLSVAFSKDDYDFIVAPFNLGAKLYLANKSSYKLDSIITTNNTYLISRNKIDNDAMLNKKVLAYGVGSGPYIGLLMYNEINKLSLNIESLNSVSDVSLSFSGKQDYDAFLMSEPFITILKNKNEDFNIYDISSSLNTTLIQACLFINPNKNIDKNVIKLIEDNINYLNNNPKDYALKIVDKNNYFKTLSSDVISDIIPRSNITYLKAKSNKNTINDFVKELNIYNNKLLNGKELPDEFYY